LGADRRDARVGVAARQRQHTRARGRDAAAGAADVSTQSGIAATGGHRERADRRGGDVVVESLQVGAAVQHVAAKGDAISADHERARTSAESEAVDGEGAEIVGGRQTRGARERQRHRERGNEVVIPVGDGAPIAIHAATVPGIGRLSGL